MSAEGMARDVDVTDYAVRDATEPNVDARYDVNLWDSNAFVRFPSVDYVTRNRLDDFAFRHDLHVCITEASAEPERKTYR